MIDYLITRFLDHHPSHNLQWTIRLFTIGMVALGIWLATRSAVAFWSYHVFMVSMWVPLLLPLRWDDGVDL